MNFGVVILAAGASARMGQPKLLLAWEGTSLLGHLIERWCRLKAAQIAVVLSPGNQPVLDELTRLGFPKRNQIVNPNPEQGMFSSIRCAAQWNGWQPELTHWIITLGDQPHVREATLRALLDFAAAHPDKICQPSRSDRRRHPVLLPRAAFRQLIGTPATTLKEFLQARSQDLAAFESDDSGLDLDIDFPVDYARAVQIANEH